MGIAWSPEAEQAAQGKERAQREALQGGCCGGHAWLCPLDEILSSRERLRVRSVKFCQSTFQGKAQNGAMGGAGEQGQTNHQSPFSLSCGCGGKKTKS